MRRAVALVAILALPFAGCLGAQPGAADPQPEGFRATYETEDGRVVVLTLDGPHDLEPPA